MAVVCSQNSAPRERLAGQAVAHRLRALNEYLAVYRATRASGGEAHTTQRIRELRSDVARLRAWGWYLSAKERGASWIPALQRLAAALSVLVSVNLVAQRRHPRGAALQHLSSYSLVERAYAALEDDTQGQLLTLRLAQMQRQLARAELQIVFHTLLRRIPTMRLAIPFDEVPFKHDRLAYGVYELPVAW